MQHHQPASTHISAAAQAFKRGDRDSAYQLVRTALLSDPTSVDAWLWLSKLVDEPARQRECLERVLSLDPQNKIARDRLEQLRLKQLLATVQAPVLREQAEGPRQIGTFLLERQLISADQLHAALREQRQLKRRGEFIQLGDLLIQKGWITPETLAHALVAQINEKLRVCRSTAPQFLGEYLLFEGLITPMQLETVLEEQMRLRMAGKRVAIGNLLLRNQCVDPARLQQVLEQQRREFYSSMGD
jgi:hypothetical protein